MTTQSTHSESKMSELTIKDIEKKVDDVLASKYATKPDGHAWCTRHLHKLDIGICISCSAAKEIMQLIDSAITEARIEILRRIPQTYDHLESGDEYVPNITTRVIKDKLAELEAQLKNNTTKQEDTKA